MTRLFDQVNTVEYISSFSKIDTMNSFRSCLGIANQLDLLMVYRSVYDAYRRQYLWRYLAYREPNIGVVVQISPDGKKKGYVCIKH